MQKLKVKTPKIILINSILAVKNIYDHLEFMHIIIKYYFISTVCFWQPLLFTVFIRHMRWYATGYNAFSFIPFRATLSTQT